MSAHREELRMVDDLEQSGEVRALLRAGVEDQVGDYDFDRGLAAHLAAVAALPPAADAPTVPAAPSAGTIAGISGKALMLWIGLPVVSATVIAAVWLRSSSEPAQPTHTAPVAASPAPVMETAPSVKPSSVQVAPLVEKSVPAPAEAARPVLPAAHAVVADEEHAARTRSQRNAASATPTVKVDVSPVAAPASPAAFEASASVAEPSAVETTETTAVEPTAEEREALARQAAEQAAQEERAREAARREAEERLKREMAQLMQAKQALTTEPARALALTEAGEREFRNSLFSEERQHVLLLALIKLGRVDEAQRRAEPFLRAHPDSPFARRVRNALQGAGPR